jgi:hypothetical protein
MCAFLFFNSMAILQDKIISCKIAIIDMRAYPVSIRKSMISGWSIQLSAASQSCWYHEIFYRKLKADRVHQEKAFPDEHYLVSIQKWSFFR